MTRSATTALLGRKNYEGFGRLSPSVVPNEDADTRDCAFSRWLDADPVATVKQLREQKGGVADLCRDSTNGVVGTSMRSAVPSW